MILDAVICIALIASVVLQSGKSAGMRAQLPVALKRYLGARKKRIDELLAKATMVLGALFAVITLVIAEICCTPLL